jgi:hypothetical protein
MIGRMRKLPFGRLLAPIVILVAVAAIISSQTSAEVAQSGSAASPQTPPCPIVASPPGADFGVVEPGTVVSATIKLTNPLDRPVTVIKATPSCTCTTIDMEGKTIPAAGTIEMPMSMKTSRSVGKKAAMVTLVFDGVPVPLVVRIDAETAYAVRANPPFIDALAPERMKGFFELLSVDGQPFTVKSIAGKPAQSADGSSMKPSNRQVVKYDLTNPGLHRSVPPFLVVETDHPKCPLLDLRVRHETTRISPALNFAEFRENVGLVENDKPVEFEVQLKHAGQLRVDRALSNNTAFEARLLDQKSDGDSLLVRVQLVPKGAPAGPFLFTCTLSAGAKSSDLWIYGSRK